MSCCGKLGIMDIKAALTYGKIKIEVVIPGFGIKAGVYEVGKNINAPTAVRLLNNHNAKLLELKVKDDSTEHIPEEPVSVSTEDKQEEVHRPGKSTKTRRSNRSKSTGSKKSRTTKHSVSKGSKTKRTSDDTVEDLWKIVDNSGD